MNSRTIHASRWILKYIRITWRWQICASQTQLLTTAQVAIPTIFILHRALLSVWRVQVWTSQLCSISQHLRSSSQEALWLWTVQYTLGPVMENTVFTGSNTLKNLIQDSFTPMEAGMISVRGKTTHKHTPVSTTCQWRAWIFLMLGPTTALSPHVDTYCLETGPSWTLKVRNFLAEVILAVKSKILPVKMSPRVWISADEVDSPALVYFLSGALTFTVILSVLLAFSMCSIKKRNNCKCAGTVPACPCSWRWILTWYDIMLWSHSHSFSFRLPCKSYSSLSNKCRGNYLLY